MLIPPRPARLALTLAAGLALSMTALAEPPPPGGPRDEPLRGPRVDDHRAPGAEGNFGAPGEHRKPGLNPRPDIRAFRDAMHDALGPDAPDHLRASPEQHDQVQTIVRAHMDDVRAYMDSHRAELESLRKQAGLKPPRDRSDGDRANKPPRGDRPRGPRAEKGSGGGDAPPPPPPDADQPGADSPNAQAARQRLKEIMQGAPKPDGMINQVWQVLSPAQRDAIETRWEELKRTNARERDQRMFETKGRRKEHDAAAAPDAQKQKVRPARRQKREAPPADGDAPESR